MVRPIPNQPVSYLVQQFKQAKFDGDIDRMNTLFDSLLWRYKASRRINKGKTQKLAAKVTKLRLKLSESEGDI